MEKGPTTTLFTSLQKGCWKTPVQFIPSHSISSLVSPNFLIFQLRQKNSCERSVVTESIAFWPMAFLHFRGEKEGILHWEAKKGTLFLFLGLKNWGLTAQSWLPPPDTIRAGHFHSPISKSTAFFPKVEAQSLHALLTKGSLEGFRGVKIKVIWRRTFTEGRRKEKLITSNSENSKTPFPFKSAALKSSPISSSDRQSELFPVTPNWGRKKGNGGKKSEFSSHCPANFRGFLSFPNWNV